jgi:acetoin utilization protein AcuB
MKTDTIRALMTKEVVSVSPDQKLLDVKHIYEKEHFHHHIPVTEDGKLVGMVSLVDFMYGINGAGLDDTDEVYTQKRVRDIMTPNPEWIAADASIETTGELLSRGRYRALPVVENEHMVGIVTTADLIRYLLKQQN